MLTQDHIDRCHHFLENGDLKNYEARMVAEVKLYWVIYNKCCPQGHPVNLQDTKMALQDWKKEWAKLFGANFLKPEFWNCNADDQILDEPRSQFLQMGFHFAHLLAYYQSARSPQSLMDGSTILEIIDLSSIIINLAIDTTDDRTRHLTDHIYHIVTFSALTLCRVLNMYDSQLRVANINIDDLDRLVMKLITWLRSIGLPCHAAHLLSDIVSSQFKKLRPKAYATSQDVAGGPEEDYSALSALGASPLSSSVGFLYPDLIGSELFEIDDGAVSWPQWS